MKFLFLKPREFEDTVKGIFLKEGKEVEVTVGYSEELNTDILKLSSNETEEIPLSSVLDKVAEYHNVIIQDYDVAEVSDFGEGFIFRID